MSGLRICPECGDYGYPCSDAYACIMDTDGPIRDRSTGGKFQEAADRLAKLEEFVQAAIPIEFEDLSEDWVCATITPEQWRRFSELREALLATTGGTEG